MVPFCQKIYLINKPILEVTDCPIPKLEKRKLSRSKRFDYETYATNYCDLFAKHIETKNRLDAVRNSFSYGFCTVKITTFLDVNQLHIMKDRLASYRTSQNNGKIVFVILIMSLIINNTRQTFNVM